MNILLVEDNPSDVRLVHEALRDLDALRFNVVHAATLGQALECLASRRLDIGLLDLDLPDSRGLDVVQQIRGVAPQMPLVVLTGNNDQRVATASLQEGAQDYLVKAEVSGQSLWRALRYAIERQRVQFELLNLSLVDDLTGLSNRKGFLSQATHHARLAERLEKPFLVGFIDLDGLKRINDTFGHQEGNRALVEAAQVLRNSFRQADILARFGGDEFAVVVTEANESAMPVVIRRVDEHVRIVNAQPQRLYELALSIGLVVHDGSQPSDLEFLLQQADALMYRHKRDKRTRKDPRASEETAERAKTAT
jgi:two-component system, cell cycle response regulator